MVYFHSKFISPPSLAGMNISHHVVSTRKEVRNLGVVFDDHLTMSSHKRLRGSLASHINSICRSASLALRNIGRVRKYLDQANTERLVHAFITSRLDYYNSLLYGLPAKEISKLQRLPNSAARLFLKCKVRDHITPSLEKLHWLPLLMTFKIINGCAPEYLSDLLETYVPTRSLRSATRGLLVVPKSFTSTYGDRAFSVAAPKLWNSHPASHTIPL